MQALLTELHTHTHEKEKGKMGTYKEVREGKKVIEDRKRELRN